MISSSFSFMISAPLADSERTSLLKNAWRRFTSKMRSVPGRTASRNARIVTRDFTERCASEPKHTASAFAASSCHCGVHSKKSHATFSMISNFGWPCASTVTLTVPVGRSTSTCKKAAGSPSRVRRRAAALPRRSLPTRLATSARSPSRAVMYAKFAGAPPSCLPEGKRSQSISPSPTTVNRSPQAAVFFAGVVLGLFILLRLQLLRELELSFGVIGAAKIAIRLAQQMMRNRVVGVHGQRTLQRSRRQFSFAFLLQHFAQKYIRTSGGGVQPNRTLQ